MNKFVAHRGYSSKAPENTLAAFQLAQEKGFKYIECDLHFTKDGIPVLIHDDTIDRTSNKTGYVKDYTYHELQQLDFGSWFSKQFKDESILSLNKFIEFCVEYQLHPYLELKNSKLTEIELLTLYKIVSHYNYLDHVTWISFNIDNLKGINKIHPQARLGILGDFNHERIKDYYTLKSFFNNVFLDVHKYHFDKKMIWVSKIMRIPLEVWTVNTKYGARYFFNKGVSRITTDQLTQADLKRSHRYQFKVTL